MPHRDRTSEAASQVSYNRHSPVEQAFLRHEILQRVAAQSHGTTAATVSVQSTADLRAALPTPLTPNATNDLRAR